MVGRGGDWVVVGEGLEFLGGFVALGFLVLAGALVCLVGLVMGGVVGLSVSLDGFPPAVVVGVGGWTVVTTSCAFVVGCKDWYTLVTDCCYLSLPIITLKLSHK